ncbi:outer membrane protein assembly factor BamD [Desulforhopalus vacuolatus]|uniref:outer membrane protein assembly factor BamD n=1 Tax=Desulforhopalus vacuolatus TaxID=40414 RepID=UPI001962E55F|nr:outer membrane protein assembly factor BamD [Desulforhopalus vacuolatus]MBM9518405.1 outer membrane protein assembly factor BamD [Desulforhopalus vacuolatus]
MSMRTTLFRCSILFLLLVVGGCSLFGSDVKYTKIDEDGNVVEEVNPFEEMPVKNLLQKGMDDYNVGKYFTAVSAFEEILDRYPFSREAVLAELKAADCYYFMDKYAQALSLYETFENNHPTNESIPYIMYQKGMCSYRQIDRVDRDPTGAEKAVASFRQLIKAFPNSTYTPAAKEKMTIAREFLAGHEFFVVKFYLRTEQYKQAEARLRYLIATYPEIKIVTDDAKPLLARLEKGEKPDRGFFSFLPGMFDKEDSLSQKSQDDVPVISEFKESDDL